MAEKIPLKTINVDGTEYVAAARTISGGYYKLDSFSLNAELAPKFEKLKKGYKYTQNIDEFTKYLDGDLSTVEKVKLVYHLWLNTNYGILTPILEDGELKYISCEGEDKPLMVYHESDGLLETNLKLNMTEISELIKLFDENPSFIKRKKGVIFWAIDNSFFGIKRVEDRINKKLVYPRISAETLAILWLLVKNNTSILIVGPKGSGRTNLLDNLTKAISLNKKMISFEDASTINLEGKHWMPVIWPKHNRGEILQRSIRQKPSWLILDEIKDDVASIVFENLDNYKLLATLPVDSIDLLVNKLTQKPYNVAKSSFANLDLIVSLGPVAGKFVVKDIVEVLGYDFERGLLKINTIYDCLEGNYSGKNSKLLSGIGSSKKIKKELIQLKKKLQIYL